MFGAMSVSSATSSLLISMPGVGEWLVILVIVLVIFGPGKLPGIGEALGKSIRNFKRTSSGTDEIDVTPPEQISESRNRTTVDATAAREERHAR